MGDLINKYEYSEFIEHIYDYYDFDEGKVSVTVQINGSICIDNAIPGMCKSYYLRNANKSILQVKEELVKILDNKVHVKIGVAMDEDDYNCCINYPNVKVDYYQKLGFLDEFAKITLHGTYIIEVYKLTSEFFLILPTSILLVSNCFFVCHT